MSTKHNRARHHNATRANNPTMEIAMLPNDVVIIVIGLTGAGKSTFINAVLGEHRMKVDQKLTPCTVKIGVAVVSSVASHPALRGHRLVLVDTPGFDDSDTTMEDYKILQCISEWLDKFSDKVILGGIIYLYDISEDRISSAARRNIQMLQRLCGDDSYNHVALGTTKWNKVTLQMGNDRQKELRDGHWKCMIEKGAETGQLNDQHLSAWNLINDILRRFTEDSTLESGVKSGVSRMRDLKAEIQREVMRAKEVSTAPQSNQQSFFRRFFGSTLFWR